MKSVCALCGRLTEPAVLIGNEAIGPKCAARAGLMAKKVPKGSRIRLVQRAPSSPAKRGETLDLFADPNE